MTSIRIPDDLHERLVSVAVERGESIEAFVREALEEYLAEQARPSTSAGTALGR